MDTKIVIITPRGTATFNVSSVKRAVITRILFNDWRSKNSGDYFDIIQKKFTEEEKNSFPKVFDVKPKIAEIIERECELFVDGNKQDVEFLIIKFWNSLNHV